MKCLFSFCSFWGILSLTSSNFFILCLGIILFVIFILLEPHWASEILNRAPTKFGQKNVDHYFFKYPFSSSCFSNYETTQYYPTSSSHQIFRAFTFSFLLYSTYWIVYFCDFMFIDVLILQQLFLCKSHAIYILPGENTHIFPK